MSMSDPLGDMLTRIRNAQHARLSMCVAPASNLRANVLDVLKREGFIRGFSREEIRPGIAQLRIELKYTEGQPVIKEINRVSRPPRLFRPGCLHSLHAARRDERRRSARRQCWWRSALPRVLRGARKCLV